jgi:hypothetical protein
MTDSLNGIITQLEQQKAAIERALAALHSLDGDAPAQAPAPAKRKGGMTPAGKRRLIAALKKRWAAKKRAAKKAAAAAAPAKPAPRKVRFTPEGRKRLAEAMKRRWAAKRAASASKKTRANNGRRRKLPDRTI